MSKAGTRTGNVSSSFLSRRRWSFDPFSLGKRNNGKQSRQSTQKNDTGSPENSGRTSCVHNPLPYHLTKCVENDSDDGTGTTGSSSSRTELFYERLIQSCSWSRMQKSLQSESGVDALISEPLVLHRALQHHAPLNIILLLLTHKPLCLDELDPSQRNALHIAAMSWSQKEIVELLLQRRRKLATAVDCNGRTALHLLLTGAHDLHEPAGPGATFSSLQPIMQCRMMSFHRVPSQSVVQLLIRAAPNTLNLEDANEMSPIELAILSNPKIQLQTIQKMRKRSEKEWKRNCASTARDGEARHSGKPLDFADRTMATNNNGNTSRSASMNTCKTVPCTTDDEQDDENDYDDESAGRLSTCSSDGSFLCLESPMISPRERRRAREDLVFTKEGRGRRLERRVSRNAISA